MLLANLMLVTIVCLSIGYSAFGVKVNISNIITDVIIKKDIRISGVRVATTEEVTTNVSLVDSGNITLINDGTSKYNEYNVNNISVGIDLPNETSSITYKVSLINLGNAEVGILSIDGLPNNITYKLSGLNLKEKICDSSNKCSLGIEKEFYITLYYVDGSYDSSDIEHDIVANFNFSQVYTVTYTDITNNNYPTEVLEGDTLEVDLGASAPKKIKVKVNGAEITNYTYTNGVLTINNINGNIEIINDVPTYTVTYEGITNNGYPTSVSEGNTLEVTFTGTIPKKVVPYINGEKISNYTYENNKITVPNITDNIVLKYIDKVYLASLPESTYFKTSDYLTKIKTISFVDNMDVPSDALATYNLQQNSGTEIKGWIDTNYNLYIGSEWDIYGTNFEDAFMGMTGVTSISFDNLDTSEVTTFYNTFNGMSNLETIDVSGFNTSSATTMRNMFNGLSKVTTLDVSGFDTTKVTNTREMFNGMSSLTSLDVSGFNTSNVTDFRHMFNNVSNVTELDVSGFNTAKATTLQGMFNGMSKVTELDVSKFITTKVTAMGNMFTDCSSLTSLDVSNFNTAKVTSMYQMFGGLSKLTSLNVSDFDTSQVTQMGGMFDGMTSLLSLDVSNFNTAKVTNMATMFRSLSKLTSLDLSSFNTSNVTDMRWLFTYNYNLKTIYVSDLWTTTNVTISVDMFAGNNSLVGGNGTVYNTNYRDKTYARIDTAETPGYFTFKEIS